MKFDDIDIIIKDIPHISSDQGRLLYHFILDKDIKIASQALGISKNDLVNRALILYLDSVRGMLDLETEFKSWDDLSDESLQNMSAGLPSKL